jgi:hypothetical protein
LQLKASSEDTASNNNDQDDIHPEEHSSAATQGNDLPHEGTEEFTERCREAWQKVCQKYAWTAQQGGTVLRKNPLKLSPYQDYIFKRIVKAEYGFRYYDRRGAKKLWYPSIEKVL